MFCYHTEPLLIFYALKLSQNRKAIFFQLNLTQQDV